MIGEIRQNFTEASASVGLILATALATKILPNRASVHTQDGCGGAISVTERSCAAPFSEVTYWIGFQSHYAATKSSVSGLV